jgi:salicylate hydroxylase
MGPDRHVLTFVVDHGKTLNLVAMASTDEPWPDEKHHVLPSTREKALKDFRAFGPGVNALIKLTKEHPDVVSCGPLHLCDVADADLLQWALYDLGDHHLPTYNRGRILLAGDAAHASTPHHGAGAGFGLEDCAVLASLLESPEVKSPAQLESVFAVFDATRRKRCQWLIDSSRVAGDLYEWRTQGFGRDADRIKDELEKRTQKVWGFDVRAATQRAREDLKQRLGQP